jgi:selenocysteine-specific elongation factor
MLAHSGWFTAICAKIGFMTQDSAPSNPLHPVLLGTAGHIDHGKTLLVSTLSGVNTDRLPEERRRGISIDLGFAHFDHEGFRFGIVDVPGHERFVRQMVAGATSLDVALLVVAADDGVMPQTIEHFEILRLLGIQRGVIAITKTDLVDDEMCELVSEEVRELAEGSFLASAPIVAVSSKTGVGIAELKDALVTAVKALATDQSTLRFRMPIDRVFSLPGRGTIVTGSILNGSVSAGDEVELLPQQRVVRVRSVQHHGTQVELADSHRRAAINLPGVEVAQIHRGCELVARDSLHTSARLLVEISCLRSFASGLTHRMLLDLHLGTQVTLSRLRLDSGGDSGRVAPGETAFAELRCHQPVVAQWGQRFIVRSSGGMTVGGGRVIDPAPGSYRLRGRAERYQAAASSDASERLQSLLGVQPSITVQEAEQRLGISEVTMTELLQNKSLREKIVVAAANHEFVHVNWLKRLARSVLRVLTAELKRRQPGRVLPESVLLSLCRGFRGHQFVPLALQMLIDEGTVVRRGDQIGPTAAQVEMTKRQRQWLDAIIQAVQDGDRTPPTHKELLAVTGIPNVKELDSLISVAREDGLLVGVAADLTYSPASLESLRNDLRQLFDSTSSLTLAQIRDAFSITRKHVVPLAEYFDEAGITIRDGNFRRPGPVLRQDSQDVISDQ